MDCDDERDDALSRTRRNKSIRKVREWQEKDCESDATIGDQQPPPKPRPVFRGRTPSYEALRCAVTELHRIDDFEAERLGEGFFSEVFKVTHKTSGRVMVLKKNKFRSNSVNSLKEIQLMNKLRHANILKFEAVCVHEGQLHALTEFIAGGTLEELIADHGTALRWSDRLGLGADIARGLHYLHSRGMFHRDLTSKNIFMKKTPDKLVAIIGDFGLATRIPAKTEPRLAQVGSPYWMSPECLRGEFYDHQADIFSFGIIMCELIARVEADPDILPRTPNFGVEYSSFRELCDDSCPPDFLKLTFTCVSIDPESRPRAGDLVSSLGEMRDTQQDVEIELVVAAASEGIRSHHELFTTNVISNIKRTRSDKSGFKTPTHNPFNAGFYILNFCNTGTQISRTPTSVNPS